MVRLEINPATGIRGVIGTVHLTQRLPRSAPALGHADVILPWGILQAAGHLAHRPQRMMRPGYEKRMRKTTIVLDPPRTGPGHGPQLQVDPESRIARPAPTLSRRPQRGLLYRCERPSTFWRKDSSRKGGRVNTLLRSQLTAGNPPRNAPKYFARD